LPSGTTFDDHYVFVRKGVYKLFQTEKDHSNPYDDADDEDEDADEPNGDDADPAGVGEEDPSPIFRGFMKADKPPAVNSKGKKKKGGNGRLATRASH
jgi:hypothetical protein